MLRYLCHGKTFIKLNQNHKLNSNIFENNFINQYKFFISIKQKFL
jgi:hypothetical protein